MKGQIAALTALVWLAACAATPPDVSVQPPGAGPGGYAHAELSVSALGVGPPAPTSQPALLAPPRPAVMQGPVSQAVAASECAPVTVAPNGRVLSDLNYLAAMKSKRLVHRQLGNDGAFYPARLQRQNIEGLVYVQFDVELDGTVTNVRVLHAAPADVFNDAAIRVTLSHRFEAIAKRCAGMVEAVKFQLR